MMRGMRLELVGPDGEVLLELELVDLPRGWKDRKSARLCDLLLSAQREGKDLSAVWPVTRRQLIAERAELLAARRVAELEQRCGDAPG